MTTTPATITAITVSLLATVGLLGTLYALSAPVWAQITLLTFAGIQAAALIAWSRDRRRGRHHD